MKMLFCLLFLSALFLFNSNVLADQNQREQLGLTNGVQFIKQHAYNQNGLHVGDDIYAYNSNSFPVQVSVWVDYNSPQTFNLNASLINGWFSIQPGQTVYLGWTRVANETKQMSYMVQWQVYYWYQY